MSDRIDPMTQGLPGKIAERLSGAGGARSAEGTVRARAPASPATPEGERIELTPGGRLLARLEQSFAAAPDIDRARVDAVKAAIQNGEYEIDADRIAAALLRTEHELGG
jgi:negative regulator of flagellin synthesis FlgM